eukprot:TRINITY_DN80083_c0_g1_i1.p1 TRINITY_DN80083_c0_g1~~TRINITY_DN80083_c0_g1_i1.p1  ORF type:complete len:400 (-),score=77.28 TRINITY_DN80083_c0_g1_i1:81-1280(-)
MLSFVNVGEISKAPVLDLDAALNSVNRAAVLSAPTANLLDSNSAGSSYVTSATLVAVVAAAFSAVRGARRRSSKHSRVALGATSGVWYPVTFRAKPGAKYKYRYPGDRNHPEFGVGANVETDREIKWGRLFFKGTVREPSLDDGDDDGWGLAPERARKFPGALLLDCDGTLAETERDGHRVAFNKAFKEEGFDFEWDVDLYGELLTTGGGKERMTRYFKDYNEGAWTAEDPPSPEHPTIVKLHALKSKLFQEIVESGELPLREGIEDLIAQASAAGWALAVCSTSAEASVRSVVSTMLPKYAKTMRIFAGDVVSEKKPDPAVYELAAKELGIAPMKCVVIEDTAIGAQAGLAAGMKVVVTKSIYSAEEDFGEADIICDSADQLDFEEDVESLLPVMELA